ncbi:MAG: ubiquinone/menaquinone biosynthesis methyltransferase [Actinomycetota bacterium]|nr:ubiquinone/menaquinone biosynthesis methyltransferase [Actinomycetota bacterium]
MFDQIVSRYDLLNDLLSFGFDRWWRRRTVASVTVPRGAIVLDLGCGTGRLGELLAGRCRVVGVDVSAGMLAEASRRLGPRVRLVRGSMFHLPFAGESLEGAVSGFVLRNLDDLPAAFAELARVLRPGAPVGIVDVTEPRGRLAGRLFDAYFSWAAPALGSLVGRRDAYRYLARSLAQLPPPGEVAEMLEQAGFDVVRARSLAPGMVTLWTARRGIGVSKA